MVRDDKYQVQPGRLERIGLKVAACRTMRKVLPSRGLCVLDDGETQPKGWQ